MAHLSGIKRSNEARGQLAARLSRNHILRFTYAVRHPRLAAQVRLAHIVVVQQLLAGAG